MRCITIVAVAVAMTATVAGCSKASSPTIYSHEEAVDANKEVFDALNASVDATGGLEAWRTWASNDPLDEHITEQNATGGSECLPTDALGLAGDPLGDFAGESLHTTHPVDAEDVLATLKKTWADAGFTTIETSKTDIGVAVRATHDAPSPTLTYEYDGTSRKQNVALEGNSICQSYAYLDDEQLEEDDDPYGDDSSADAS